MDGRVSVAIVTVTLLERVACIYTFPSARSSQRPAPSHGVVYNATYPAPVPQTVPSGTLSRTLRHISLLPKRRVHALYNPTPHLSLTSLSILLHLPRSVMPPFLLRMPMRRRRCQKDPLINHVNRESASSNPETGKQASKAVPPRERAGVAPCFAVKNGRVSQQIEVCVG